MSNMLATEQLLLRIDDYELRFKTLPTLEIMKGWAKELINVEQQNIIEAYTTSTLDQCNDIAKLFGEKDVEPTDDEMKLIEKDALEYFQKKYKK